MSYSDEQLGITFDASQWLTNYNGFVWGPNIIVIHSLECDSIPGIARALSEPGGYLDTENLAPQRMTAPGDLVRTIPDGTQGGHIGGPGNSHCAGVEVSGRAAWTPGQWDTPLAREALDMQARAIAGLAVVYGWGLNDLRYLSLAQIRAGDTRGICDHNSISLSGISATNHWDVGLGYPFAAQLARIKYWFLVITGNTPVDPDGWLDMGAREDILAAVAAEKGAVGALAAQVTALAVKVDALNGRLFGPPFDKAGLPIGHTLRGEVQWSAANQTIPAVQAAATGVITAAAVSALQKQGYRLARESKPDPVTGEKPTGAVYAYGPLVWYHVKSGADWDLGKQAKLYPSTDLFETDRPTLERIRDLCLPTDMGMYVPPVVTPPVPPAT